MRLQKFLALAGVASRRQAERLIREGAVQVNGAVVTALGTRVDEGKDTVDVEGRRARAEELLYRVLLKPRECLATLGKGAGRGHAAGGAAKAAGPPRPTLARYVPDVELGWQVVAPLDFRAEGVVLLTTDGGLAAAMSRGGGHVAMTYHLKLQGTVGEAEVERLRRGWRWLGRPVRPAAVDRLATTGKNTWIEMTVAESRPRVLKGAGDMIRHSLLKVSRVRLGAISFEGLKMGGWRDLSGKEVAALRQAAGLPGV